MAWCENGSIRMFLLFVREMLRNAILVEQGLAKTDVVWGTKREVMVPCT